MNRNKTGIDHLLAILHDAEIACNHGDYVQAEILYTNAIEIDRCNPALYGNRSAVHYYLKNLMSAVNDAEKAIKIEPTYSKVDPYILGSYSFASNGIIPLEAILLFNARN